MNVATIDEDPSQLPRYRRAFEATTDERRSVPEKDFVSITLDVAPAVFGARLAHQT
jgi:hypothetical protein